MWGEVTPAERLRAVTRRNIDEDELAAEAADALAGFAAEPASLVVACRRVLAHHRTHAPLWWVCARILSASEPGAAAHTAARELHGDPTGARLGAALPLLDDEDVVATVGWSAAVDEAVDERFDLAVVAVRVDGVDTTRALRRRRSDRTVPVVDSWDPVLARAVRVLVPAAVIGPEQALVPFGSRDVLDIVTNPTAEVWLVGGVGRVLPARLYDALCLGLDDDLDEFGLETLSLQRVDRIAGPRGIERPVDAVARVDCPVAPELLRPL